MAEYKIDIKTTQTLDRAALDELQARVLEWFNDEGWSSTTTVDAHYN